MDAFSNTTRSPGQPRSSRIGLWSGIAVAGFLITLLAASIFVSSSLANASPGWSGGHGFHHRGEHDPERAKEHIAFVAERVLRWVDASVAQREAVIAALERGVDGLSPLAAQHRAHRQALMDALTQDTLDRTAIERIRRDGLELLETASQQLTTTLVEVAEALTPEQRLELLETARRFHH